MLNPQRYVSSGLPPVLPAILPGAMLRLLAVIPLVVVATKGPCNEYFGKGTDDNSTVLDPQRLFRAATPNFPSHA